MHMQTQDHATAAAPAPAHEHAEGEWRMLAISAAACALFGAAGLFVERVTHGPEWLRIAFFAAGLVAGGWDAAIDSFENIKARKLDIHFLMLAVAVGAACIGAWPEAILLLFLFCGAGAMEEYAMERTQREVSSLLKSAPKSATLIDGAGAEKIVGVETLRVGDLVRVKPGEAFSADGVVRKGQSASDESNLTGEAAPVDKREGAEVYSGTINLWGVVDFEVRKLPSESTLQKIIRLIQTAQKLRAPSERFTDKFGGGYTLVALGTCAVMFFVWWLVFGVQPFGHADAASAMLGSHSGDRSAFYRAMTLLVVMSPCALVLSIPSAILAAIAWGAKHGVLFRGGAAIEKLADVTVLALDKTGTLTTGELSVSGVESFPAGREQDVLEMAAALEANSHHPLARAITRHAQARGARARSVEGFESLTGMGLRGRVDGAQVLLGRRELLADATGGGGGAVDATLAEKIRATPHAATDLTEVWVSGDGVAGRILLRDQIRETSRVTLDKLRRAGVRTVMLTGDRRNAAETVAKEIGIDEVRAGLTPEGKVAAIQDLRGRATGGARVAGGGRVAMVGDGVNDAPCLAAADVSIAMGARGSDAALEQAEVILMHDRIENVLAAFNLSRRAKKIIRQNLTVALGVVVLMAVSALFGIIPLWLGVTMHEGSSVVVCLNALRLLFGENRAR